MSDRKIDEAYRDARYDDAITELEKGLKKQEPNGRDLLLYLLDLGLTNHAKGDYSKSNQYFLRSEDIADIKDYTSLAAESATLLTTENIKDYKGEDHEKILINCYLAINYALMGSLEDALVEARKVNRKLYLMITEGKRKYELNAFARYLSGILYEMEGEWDDAYLSYKETRELMPQFPGLGLDLWRMASRRNDREDMKHWKEEYELKTEQLNEVKVREGKDSDYGELVVVYQNGISPIKKPNPNFYSVPQFFARYNPAMYGEVLVNGEKKGQTAVLFNIESTAIRNLDEKYGGIVAKKIGGVVAKEAVGYGVARATDSPLLGFLTKLFLYATDEADLRSWNLLPKDLQLVRIPLPAGEYDISLRAYGAQVTLPTQRVKVEAKKKKILSFRYLP